MGKNYNLHGLWKVTTEGDCEGRSVYTIGFFRGWLDEIALHLASACTYTLNFYKIDDKEREYRPTRKSVDVCVHDLVFEGSGATAKYRKVFEDNGRNVGIEPGRYAGNFKISSDVKTDEERKAEILAKLTAEEKEILGLKG